MERALGSPGGARVVAALAALGLAGAACRRPQATPEADALAEQAREWRAQGPAAPGGTEGHLAAARLALQADLPGRTAEALGSCRLALAAEPGEVEALACWVTAFAWLAGQDPDGEALRRGHRLLAFALPRADGRPDLLAARSRLLRLSPGAANAREALTSAEAARALAPDGRDALLALGEASLPDDPEAASGHLDRAWEAWGDRRALRLSAQARWVAGDAAGALDRLRRRLELDPAQPEALALRAEIEMGLHRFDAARATLRRWARLDAASARPLLEQARLAAQLDADPRAARQLLAEALARPADDFLRARLLAERAAVEAALGDPAASRRSVEEALARVPASAPARFQDAALAWHRGDARALRESAGVLGERAGPRTGGLLQARLAVVERRYGEAAVAYQAIARDAGPDLELLVEAAGALARLQALDAAFAAAAEAGRRDPAEPRQRVRLREFWEAPREMVEAAEALADLARHQPARAAEALQAAALARLLLGHTRAAEALARRASEEAPDAARPHALLAQVELDRGRPREALAAAEEAVRRGDGGAGQAVRARALEALGRTEEALAACRRSLAAGPALPTARLSQALLLRRTGQAPAARKLLEALVRDDPGQSRARGALLDLRP